MTVSDPIADMLTRIRNALMARRNEVRIPYSNLQEAVAMILEQEGYISGYQVEEGTPHNWLKIRLKWVGTRRLRRPVISGLKRVSKPGRRIYVGYKEIPWVLSGMGISIISTPQGVLSGSDARRRHLGGELLCKIW